MTWPTKEEIQPPETGRTSHYTGAFSEEIYPKRATSFWHLVVPQMNPQRHILLAPFWYTQKEMPKEYNILTWPHNLFFFLPVYLCSAKHRESLFLATFSSAPPPSHPVVVQGAASQKARMSPQRSFRITPALETSMPASITDTTHTKQLSLPPKLCISGIRAVGSRMMENGGQGQDRDWPCSKTRCSISAWNVFRIRQYRVF